MHIKFQLDNLKERNCFGGLGTTDIKMELGEQGMTVWTGFIWFRRRPVVGYCEDCNKLSDYINVGEVLDFRVANSSSKRAMLILT